MCQLQTTSDTSRFKAQPDIEQLIVTQSGTANDNVVATVPYAYLRPCGHVQYSSNCHEHQEWVSKPEWFLPFKSRVGSALFALGGGIHVTHSLTFTSGATPGDLLMASMATKPISSTYQQTHWWDSNRRALTPRAKAQLTELCQCHFEVSFQVTTDKQRRSDGLG